MKLLCIYGRQARPRKIAGVFLYPPVHQNVGANELKKEIKFSGVLAIKIMYIFICP
jgi:hypothetical protein